jgi:hypothetical protein
MDPCDTHRYDNQLHPQRLPLLATVASLPLSVLRQRIEELAARVIGVGGQYLRQIASEVGSPTNYDPGTGLRADHLAGLAWELRHNTEFLSLLEEQLADMSTGFCPQGRTHRLFQSLLPFMEGSTLPDALEDGFLPSR